MLNEVEQTFLSSAVENALIKLRILSLNSECSDITDPTNSYSVADVISQKVQLLERLRQPNVELGVSRPLELTKLFRVSFDEELQPKLLNEINELEDQSIALDRTLRDLQEEFFQQTQLKIAENRFVDKWESARREQLLQSLDLRTAEFQKQLNQQQWNVDCALDAARKIDQYYTEQLAKVETDVNEWMERFDREKDQIDSRSQKARAKQRHWDEMKLMVEQRKEEIRQLEEVESRYLRDAEHKRMCQKYAVKLQAWWRGVMVRRQLGRFKKVKKGKGKKNKKAKAKSQKLRK